MSYLKLAAKGLLVAFNDPYIQGVLGLLLLARSSAGIAAQFEELQKQVQETYATMTMFTYPPSPKDNTVSSEDSQGVSVDSGIHE